MLKQGFSNTFQARALPHREVTPARRLPRRPHTHTARCHPLADARLPHALHPEAPRSPPGATRAAPCHTGPEPTADRRSVGGAAPYACRLRSPYYGGSSTVTTTSPARFPPIKAACFTPPRADTAAHRAAFVELRPPFFPRPSNRLCTFPRPHRTCACHLLSGPALAVRPRRRLLRPDFGYPQALGERVVKPHYLPGLERRRLAGIRPAPPPPHAKDPIARSSFFLRGCL
jgi:hypothetical protein